MPKTFQDRTVFYATLGQVAHLPAVWYPLGIMHPHEALSDKQKQAVRYLAEHRKEVSVFQRQQVIDATGLTDDEYERLILFLERRKAADGAAEIIGLHRFDRVYISGEIIEIVHELDNPPPRHRWEEWATWFHSKWWSIPVRIVFVGLPALVGYITMIRFVLNWMEIPK